MQVVVVVPDGPFVRSFTAIAVEDAVGGFRIDRIEVDIDRRTIARFLLGDRKDVAVEAGRPDPYHIRVPLVEVARKDKHIPDAVHRLAKVGTPASIEAVDVEIGDAGHLVCGERNLGVCFLVEPELVVGGR